MGDKENRQVPAINIREVVTLIIFSLIFLFVYRFDYFFSGKIVKGGDPEGFFYPSAYYLYQQLISGKFPFWTERIFLGFPAFAMSEFAYLNPLRIIGVLVFGPFAVFKFEHILFYLLGVIGIYGILKKTGVNILGIFVSIITYYFSFFHIYRTIHFNFLLTTYLLPINIFLIWSFITSNRLRYLLINALLVSITIYYGNYNAVALCLIPQILLFAVYITKVKILELVKGLMVMLFFISMFSMPAIMSTYSLYSQSTRGSGNLNFVDGSIAPILSLSVVYPFLLGYGENFIGQTINNNYYEHEIYFYFGIVSVLLAIIGYVFQERNSRVRLFLSLNIAIFFIFGFLEYLPFKTLLNVFPVNLFRYYVRTSFLGLLSVSIFSAIGLHILITNTDFKLTKTRIIRILVLCIIPFYYLLLDLINPGLIYSKQILAFIIRGGALYEKIWFTILVSSIIIFVFFLKQKKFRKIYTGVIIFLVIADLYFFTGIVGNELLIEKYIPDAPELGNTRVLYTNPEIIGNMPLYWNNWSVYGTSTTFESGLQKELYKSHGLKSIRRFDDSFRMDQLPAYSENLTKLGIEKVIVDDNTVLDLNNENNVFDKSIYGLTGNVIEAEEGHIKYEIDSDKRQEITTKIKNFTGWRVFINNIERKVTSTKDDLFIKFYLDMGKNIVEMQYFPLPLYRGLLISFCLLLVYLYFRLVRLDKIKKFILFISIVLSLAVFLYKSDYKSVFTDEVLYLESGREYLSGNFENNLQHPLIGKYIAGISDFTRSRDLSILRLPFVLLSFGTAIVTFMIISPVYGFYFGILGMLLYTTMPFTYISGRMILFESPMHFFWSLFHLYFLKYLKNRNLKTALVAGFFIGLSMGTKYTSIILYPFSLLIVLMVCGKKINIRQLLTMYISSAFVFGITWLHMVIKLGMPSLIIAAKEAKNIFFGRNEEGKIHVVNGKLYEKSPFWFYFYYIYHQYNPVQMIVSGLSVLAALFRRKYFENYWLIFLLFTFVFHQLLSLKNDRYISSLELPLTILIVSLFYYLYTRLNNYKWVVLILVLSLFIWRTFDLLQLKPDKYNELRNYLSQQTNDFTDGQRSYIYGSIRSGRWTFADLPDTVVTRKDFLIKCDFPNFNYIVFDQEELLKSDKNELMDFVQLNKVRFNYTEIGNFDIYEKIEGESPEVVDKVFCKVI